MHLQCPAFVISRSPGEPLLLSALLRARTALLHRQTEGLLALPDVIRTRSDYCIWLSRFLGFYEPLERSLAGFPGWETSRFPRPSCNHSASLADDLATLGVNPAGVMRAPDALLPNLPTFAHALGALYVLEGATLGGRIILRDIEARIGDQIADATLFFGGRGRKVGATWQSFQAALDAFGYEQPLLHANVVAGAGLVFRTILAWFAPFRTGEAEH